MLIVRPVSRSIRFHSCPNHPRDIGNGPYLIKVLLEARGSAHTLQAALSSFLLARTGRGELFPAHLAPGSGNTPVGSLPGTVHGLAAELRTFVHPVREDSTALLHAAAR